jgi:site-specific recombinase XerD
MGKVSLFNMGVFFMGARTSTVATATSDFLLAKQIEGLSKNTLGEYSTKTARFAAFLSQVGIHDVEDVTAHHVRQYLASLEGCSSVTVGIHVKILRTYFRWLVRNAYLESDPMEMIPTPKVPRIFPYVLSEDEVAELLAVARASDRDHAILLLLLDTGVRASELCDMTVDGISLATRSARVYGKGQKERTVFYSDVTARAVARWLTVRDPADLVDNLFVGRTGQPLTRSGMLQLVRRLGRKAGIDGKRISPHTLRHTFATLYVKEGGDAHSLQQMLGHTTTKMAEAYVNLVGRDIAEAHRKYSPVGRLERRRKS